MTQENPNLKKDFLIALSWCLAWGAEREPQFDLSVLHQMKDAITNDEPVPTEVEAIVEQVKALQDIPDTAQPRTIEELNNLVGNLWEQNEAIGIVYGGATKIKKYVFESANLMEIRGASAILDRVNLVDLPAFFHSRSDDSDVETYQQAKTWFAQTYPDLEKALIPELVIYSTGGNILAFCPAAFANELSDAIEKRYTEVTLTANSCAVGLKVRLLEIRFGIFNQSFDKTPWFDWYKKNAQQPIVKSYYGEGKDEPTLLENFFSRKSFNEITAKLAGQFNQRRSGNSCDERLSRAYPPILETHPYLHRDDNDATPAIAQIRKLPSQPYFSEPLARKYCMGQKTKREDFQGNWFSELGLDWEAGYVKSWVERFKDYLDQQPSKSQEYYRECSKEKVKESRSLEEIGNAGKNFVSFIYADGNNMGGYIQKIKTPAEYKEFSADIFEATEQSVYYALAKNLHPHALKQLRQSDSQNREGEYIHPFEIITIGGDDVLLIVPASQAMQIAKDIGERFEEILLEKGDRYRLKEPDKISSPNTPKIHRYRKGTVPKSQCSLSTSMGVLITSYNTPIYYAQNLTNQLLKSAKDYAKKLKKKGYYSGTVDFFSLKSVTMISSNIKEFRETGLTILKKPKLKLYASPYTLYEVDGMVETISALKQSDFPRSQIYQIRTLLEQGKRTAILNYRYFRTRLNKDKSQLLIGDFEQAWCEAKGNDGNLAPWMSLKEPDDSIVYETIWRDLVDLYSFIEIEEEAEVKI